MMINTEEVAATAAPDDENKLISNSKSNRKTMMNKNKNEKSFDEINIDDDDGNDDDDDDEQDEDDDDEIFDANKFEKFARQAAPPSDSRKYYFDKNDQQSPQLNQHQKQQQQQFLFKSPSKLLVQNGNRFFYSLSGSSSSSQLYQADENTAAGCFLRWLKLFLVTLAFLLNGAVVGLMFYSRDYFSTMNNRVSFFAATNSVLTMVFGVLVGLSLGVRLIKRYYECFGLIFPCSFLASLSTLSIATSLSSNSNNSSSNNGSGGGNSQFIYYICILMMVYGVCLGMLIAIKFDWLLRVWSYRAAITTKRCSSSSVRSNLTGMLLSIGILVGLVLLTRLNLVASNSNAVVLDGVSFENKTTETTASFDILRKRDRRQRSVLEEAALNLIALNQTTSNETFATTPPPTTTATTTTTTTKLPHKQKPDLANGNMLEQSKITKPKQQDQQAVTTTTTTTATTYTASVSSLTQSSSSLNNQSRCLSHLDQVCLFQLSADCDSESAAAAAGCKFKFDLNYSGNGEIFQMKYLNESGDENCSSSRLIATNSSSSSSACFSDESQEIQLNLGHINCSMKADNDTTCRLNLISCELKRSSDAQLCQQQFQSSSPQTTTTTTTSTTLTTPTTSTLTMTSKTTTNSITTSTSTTTKTTTVSVMTEETTKRQKIIDSSSTTRSNNIQRAYYALGSIGLVLSFLFGLTQICFVKTVCIQICRLLFNLVKQFISLIFCFNAATKRTNSNSNIIATTNNNQTKYHQLGDEVITVNKKSKSKSKSKSLSITTPTRSNRNNPRAVHQPQQQQQQQMTIIGEFLGEFRICLILCFALMAIYSVLMMNFILFMNEYLRSRVSSSISDSQQEQLDDLNKSFYLMLLVGRMFGTFVISFRALLLLRDDDEIGDGDGCENENQDDESYELENHQLVDNEAAQSRTSSASLAAEAPRLNRRRKLNYFKLMAENSYAIIVLGSLATLTLFDLNSTHFVTNQKLVDLSKKFTQSQQAEQTHQQSPPPPIIELNRAAIIILGYVYPFLLGNLAPILLQMINKLVSIHTKKSTTTTNTSSIATATIKPANYYVIYVLSSYSYFNSLKYVLCGSIIGSFLTNLSMSYFQSTNVFVYVNIAASTSLLAFYFVYFKVFHHQRHHRRLNCSKFLHH